MRPQPSTKVKNLLWDPIIPNQLTNTVWSNIDESEIMLENQDL